MNTFLRLGNLPLAAVLCGGVRSRDNAGRSRHPSGKGRLVLCKQQWRRKNMRVRESGAVPGDPVRPRRKLQPRFVRAEYIKCSSFR
jgi:hypothetical protein